MLLLIQTVFPWMFCQFSLTYFPQELLARPNIWHKLRSMMGWLKLRTKNTSTIILLHGNQNDYFSGTECWIYLKPGCKFKFVYCLDIYLRKFAIFDHGGTLDGPLSPRVPKNGPGRIHLEVGYPWRSRRVSWAFVRYQNDQKRVP